MSKPRRPYIKASKKPHFETCDTPLGTDPTPLKATILVKQKGHLGTFDRGV